MYYEVYSFGVADFYFQASGHFCSNVGPLRGPINLMINDLYQNYMIV